MDANMYQLQWRYRIEKLRIYFIGKDDHIIPNPTGMFGMKITYPMIFHDIDQAGNDILFSARRFECR